MRRTRRQRPGLGLTLELPEDLTPAQAAAILQLLTDLRERLFDRYLPQVQQYLRDEQTTDTGTHEQPPSDPPF